MKKTYLLFALLLFFTVTSCTVAKISGKGAVPVLLNQPSEQMQLIEHVSIKKNKNFDYTNSFDVSEIMARIIAEKQPDAVINTTVTIKQGVDNYFINLFTLGLANSTKIIIDADMMKNKSKN
jgi:hypothetical protein